ncbi:MAG: hypothetical protein JWN40_3501 [Phycisphaerales bacterium]|nr:hypothetical protein [Phycisphaerales bacterium]
MRCTLLLFVLIISSSAIAQPPVLPTGAHPPALEFPHFPSRLHAFIWRNWNLVETDRLAKVLETSAENVRALAASMGLPAEQPPPPAYRARLYLSIIRRNWHLLPYEQLLTLLDMTAAQLAQILREDDFFFIKLGLLKPNCAKLAYAAPDDAAIARAAEIAKLIQEHFADDPNIRTEPPLAFLEPLSKPIPDAAVRPARPDPDHPRFLYSYFAVFGDPLADPTLDPYPDALLQRYADLGVNGVWLHVVLRDLAPSAEFPEFGQGHERRLANLAKLVARAKRFDIGVYLYMNEPRAMPADFFKGEGRHDMAGVVEGDHTAMCTSHPAVRRWLADSLAHVFTSVPDLAGIFTITASENLTNCASHGHAATCSHCKDRKPAEILAEVNAAVEQGVHRAAPKAKTIAWDWGWSDAVATDVIAALPASMWLMSVSEWSLPLNRGGIKTAVGEYSISAVGPGPRARKHWQLARSRGLKTLAKVQANNTWELSAVPYLPAYDLIAQHASNLASTGIDGVMLSWSLGGYPSPNLELFQRVAGGQDPQTVLDDLAQRQFGPQGSAHARKAWTLFSQAFQEFPYNGSVNYNAPLQVGPANLLFTNPTKYHATMVGIPYDDLNTWRGPYPAHVFIGQFQKLISGWNTGLAELQAAADNAPLETSAAAHTELRLARAALLHFASVTDQSRFVQTRDALAVPNLSPEKRTELQTMLHQLLQDESDRAKELYRLQRQDSRIGFEASNHYYYLPQDLQEKFLNCQQLRETMGR